VRGHGALHGSSSLAVVDRLAFRAGERAGLALARAGADLYVGVPGTTGGGSDEVRGAVHVFRIAEGALAYRRTLVSDRAGERFGAALAALPGAGPTPPVAVLATGAPGGAVQLCGDVRGVCARPTLGGIGGAALRSVAAVSGAGPGGGGGVVVVGAPDAAQGAGAVAFLDASGQVVATRFGGTLAGLGGGSVTRAGDFLGTERALVALGTPGP
jgi:hypothetical protein